MWTIEGARTRSMKARARLVAFGVRLDWWPSVVTRGAVCAALGLAALQGSAQMSVAGSPSVSDNGAATYSLPIAVPPGIAGMDPKLSIGYSSQGGNGPLGIGWTLSDLAPEKRIPC